MSIRHILVGAVVAGIVGLFTLAAARERQEALDPPPQSPPVVRMPRLRPTRYLPRPPQDEADVILTPAELSPRVRAE